jgi:hypothetical protein
LLLFKIAQTLYCACQKNLCELVQTLLYTVSVFYIFGWLVQTLYCACELIFHFFLMGFRGLPIVLFDNLKAA